MIKKTNILFLSIVIGILVIAGCARVVDEKKQSILADGNTLLIQEYSYNYHRFPDGHQVIGESETLSFKYNETIFNLNSERTSPGPVYGQIGYTHNFRNDKYIFENFTGIRLFEDIISGEKLPNNCVADISVNLPEGYVKEPNSLPDRIKYYVEVTINCSSQLNLTILNKDSFDSCLKIYKECNLIYGEDIQIES